MIPTIDNDNNIYIKRLLLQSLCSLQDGGAGEGSVFGAREVPCNSVQRLLGKSFQRHLQRRIKHFEGSRY